MVLVGITGTKPRGVVLIVLISGQWCITVVATNQAPARDHVIVALSMDKKTDIEVWGTCRLSKAGQIRFVLDGNSVFLSV